MRTRRVVPTPLEPLLLPVYVTVLEFSILELIFGPDQWVYPLCRATRLPLAGLLYLGLYGLCLPLSNAPEVRLCQGLPPPIFFMKFLLEVS